jgi:hypothetical protein
MIDVEQEIAEANARLPVALPDREMPLDIQLRSIALAVAQRHVGDTCVKEGGLYQQLKMDNKLGDVVSAEHVLRTALVFERYLWGEFSKGIAENAIAAVSTAAADAIEKEFEARSGSVEQEFKDEPPTRPHGGGESS